MLTPQQISAARSAVGMQPLAPSNPAQQSLSDRLGIGSTPTPTSAPQSAEPGFFDRLKTDFGNRRDAQGAILDRQETGKQNTGDSAVQTFGNAVGATINDPVNEIFKSLGLDKLIGGVQSGVKSGAAAIGKGLRDVVGAPQADALGKNAHDHALSFLNHPDVKPFVNAIQAMAANPRIVNDLKAVGEVAQGAGTAVGAKELVTALPEAAGAIKSKLPSALGGPVLEADAAAANVAKEAALVKRGIQDATPAYSKNLIGEPSVNGVPRVQEGGGVNKERTVTSTPKEVEAGTELAGVPGYAEAKTSLDKYNSIEPEIAKQGQALDASLEKEGVLRPPQQISKVVRDAVNKAGSDSLLLQKSDPIIKNYMRVTNRAIAQSPGTVAGERAIVKMLDNAYEDAGGKYTNNKGLDQVHRAARNALIDDMEANSKSTEVKASLKKMRNLYNAADVLQDKARAEGGSKLEQFMKAHPMATKAAKVVGKAVGLGAGIHLLP